MIEIRLMGGLGNQMFQYAILRTLSLEWGDNGVIDLSGITNRTHNVYSLNHLNISKEIKIINKSKKIRAKINYFIYGYYFVFLQKSKNGFKRLLRIEKIFQKFGMYCIPDGYAKLNPSKAKYKSLIGYYTSSKYFKKYEKIIKSELKVKAKINSHNIELLKQIQNTNSICLHIRRGDYVGTNLQVCTDKYYLNAIEKMKKIIKKPVFYVFSDDIGWVKKHFDFGKNFIYIERRNPNYEELRLMYNCKNFIISNSTFSWWAQYLSENKDKKVISPNIWYINKNVKCDIFEDDWIKIDV